MAAGSASLDRHVVQRWPFWLLRYSHDQGGRGVFAQQFFVGCTSTRPPKSRLDTQQGAASLCAQPSERAGIRLQADVVGSYTKPSRVDTLLWPRGRASLDSG